MKKSAPLRKYLANLGYGSRRDVLLLFAQGRITLHDGTRLQPDDSTAHDDVRVDDEPLDPPPGSVILLHKPIGYVCSTTDASNSVVYDLLPSRFAHRSPLMSPVGRLDLDTSGLLIVTDDGQLNHRLTSPRTHVPKTYIATLSSSLRGDEAALVASGTLLLEGDDKPLLPAELYALSATTVRVVLHEGRYHQVRRMFAALGHHVVTLQRIAIGTLTLGEQGEGTWRVLTQAECADLTTLPTPGL